jgi:hypothetical protein
MNLEGILKRRKEKNKIHSDGPKAHSCQDLRTTSLNRPLSYIATATRDSRSDSSGDGPEASC